ncbi:MAG: hypothetical protein CMF55_03120 [Legionellales bacterium]|nr:hypothetical protein [Legionellales bacterium]HAG61920.1 hypothetical protein [Coxiellaceae bacterium]
MQHYDLIIIGNGLAGASLIQTIKHLPLRIALLDRQHLTHQHLPNNNTSDTRPITLNHTSTTILDTLGLWSELSHQATPLQHLLITEQGRFGQFHLSAEEINTSSLGHVIPYTQLEHQLHSYPTDALSINRLTSHQLLEIINNSEGATVTYLDEEQHTHSLHAPLLIAADGTHSPVCEHLNITSTCHDSGAQAYVIQAQLSKPTAHPSTAYQRFTQLGSFAWLPQWTAQQARIVCTIPKRHLDAIKTWDEQAWISHLNEIYQGRQPAIDSGKITGQYPLMIQTQETCVHDSTILIGNAAHTLYPITAQGFNLTLLSVAKLAEILTNNYQQYQSLKHKTSLSHYNDWCKSTHTQVTQHTQRIDQLFNSPLIGPARSFGLLAANIHPVFKKHLIKPFLGQHTTLPRLACNIPLTLIDSPAEIADPIETL